MSLVVSLTQCCATPCPVAAARHGTGSLPVHAPLTTNQGHSIAPPLLSPHEFNFPFCLWRHLAVVLMELTMVGSKAHLYGLRRGVGCLLVCEERL